MDKISLIICVRRDIDPVMRDFFNFNKKAREMFNVYYCDNIKQVHTHLTVAKKKNPYIIIDTVMSNEPTTPLIKEIKNEIPSIKVLLIGSSEIKKDDLVELIKTKTVNGVLMRPFSQNDLIEKVLQLVR